MKRKTAMVSCLVVCLHLLLAGCTIPLSDLEGTYATMLVVDIKPECGGAEGYYQRKGPLLDYICLSSRHAHEWQRLWGHESDHLFRNMVGLKQPAGHEIKSNTPTGRMVK
jgi:hypothetical protein